MKKAFVMLPLAIACCPLFVNAALSDSERISQLEQELAILQEASSYESLSDRMAMNGFFTGKMGVANNNAGYGNRTGVEGYTTDPDFALGSKLGLQGTFSLTEQTKIIGQLVSRGDEDWSPEMEWAFLSHDFENGFVTRVGRLRVPLYMYSDYLEVGYAQPWATPPPEVYYVVPVSSYDGIDILYDTDLGNGTLSLQGMYGHAVDKADENPFHVDVEFNKAIGVSATYFYEDWTFRTNYFQTEIESEALAVPVVPIQPFEKFNKESAYFVGVGVSYDNGSFLFISEYTISDVDKLYSDTKSGYLTLGYRFGAYTPYINMAFLDTTDDSKRSGKPVAKALLNWERTAYSIGTRYDITSNLSVKADITYAGSFGNTSGALSGNTESVLLNNKPADDSTIVYTVSFDVVF